MNWRRLLYNSVFNEALKLEPTYGKIIDGEKK